MRLSFFRDAYWLHPARVTGYLWLLALLNIAILVFLLTTSRHGVDRNGFLLGTDFLSFWTAGQMLHLDGNVYDTAAHIVAQRRFFSQENSYTAFFYPPSFLPFCYLLGFLSYFPALALWLLATGAAYLAAVRHWLRETGLTTPTLLVAAAFPPVLITITHGQTSFLAAALLGLGAIWVKDRPTLAGICFGLATIKPQFGLLVPLVLLLTGEWRVIVTAALTACLLALAASLAFGAGIWGEWLAASKIAQLAMDEGVVGYAKMQSPFAAAMLLGASLKWAYAVQALAICAVLAGIVRAGWRQSYSPALAAMMLTGSLLTTPFVLDYDLVLLAFPLIWMSASDFGPWERLAIALTFIAPAFARPLAVSAGIPIMAFIIPAFFALLLRKAERANPRPVTAG